MINFTSRKWLSVYLERPIRSEEMQTNIEWGAGKKHYLINVRNHILAKFCVVCSCVSFEIICSREKKTFSKLKIKIFKLKLFFQYFFVDSVPLGWLCLDSPFSTNILNQIRNKMNSCVLYAWHDRLTNSLRKSLRTSLRNSLRNFH